MGDSPDLGSPKDDWREWARTLRRDVDFADLSPSVCHGLRQFPPLRHEATVLTYLPMHDEIDLIAFREATESRLRWATTRTPEEGPLTIHEFGGSLETHALGFLQPYDSAPRIPASEIDVALVPGLAFDLWGTRLGRGKGYYDQLLARLPISVVKVGIVPTALVADRLPSEDHDVPMQWLASEEGVIGTA